MKFWGHIFIRHPLFWSASLSLVVWKCCHPIFSPLFLHPHRRLKQLQRPVRRIKITVNTRVICLLCVSVVCLLCVCVSASAAYILERQPARPGQSRPHNAGATIARQNESLLPCLWRSFRNSAPIATCHIMEFSALHPFLWKRIFSPNRIRSCGTF